ncbi:TPA: hypothetical protein N0F65_011133, partial [Lagenidium giganteum]
MSTHHQCFDTSGISANQHRCAQFPPIQFSKRGMFNLQDDETWMETTPKSTMAATVATPEQDIDAHVPWSWVRCFSSIFALALLATDIPRTGLGTINYAVLYPRPCCGVMLWSACDKARAPEAKYSRASVCARNVASWKAFLSIPPQVIVYGSWVPLLGYAAAHYVDCGLSHVLFYCLWATSNGLASIEMRNACVFSLFVKLMVRVQATLFQARHGHTLQHVGRVSIRGFVIGLTSAISVFALWRGLEFRDTNIVYFEVLPAASIGHETRTKCETSTEFGFRYELLVLSIGVVL